MSTEKTDPFSLRGRDSRVHYDVAVALTSILPVLALSFVFMRLMWDKDVESYVPALVIFIALVMVVIGNMLMSKYPMTLMKLRDHLQDLAAGELPVQIDLEADENDITAIERYLNEILVQLKKKVRHMEFEQTRLELQLCQAHRLQSIGSLASGIAHEINTPIQFVGDNTRFVADAMTDVFQLLSTYREWAAARDNSNTDERLEFIKRQEKKVDLPFLLSEMPAALEQSLEGIEQAAQVARSMKEFSHMVDGDAKSEADVNKLLETTITVSRNEWKYVADIVREFDPHLPLVHCCASEIKQVVLNLIVNAAQAIESSVTRNPDEKGQVTIKTLQQAENVNIVIADTGGGIPADVKEKIFDPFFTTKRAGKGSGQGLYISKAIIEKKHGGKLLCESEDGNGSRFTISLPLQSVTRKHGAETSEVSSESCTQKQKLQLCASSW